MQGGMQSWRLCTGKHLGGLKCHVMGPLQHVGRTHAQYERSAGMPCLQKIPTVSCLVKQRCRMAAVNLTRT